ncbi:MAG: nicotinate-nucleotide adenylyltransferase [Gemmatimonadaceae bacterium]
MRIGILGGTFDPPHVGHLLAASDAYEFLGLDRLLFIPAAQQPLKALPNGPVRSSKERAPTPDRLEMVRLSIANDHRFELSLIEIDRGGLSYTIDTLSDLAEQSRGDTRYLLVGTDVLATFAKWRQPERILQLATLAVFTRASDAGGARASRDGLVAQWKASHGSALAHEPVFFDSRRVDVSSTEIRERVASGRSIHGFVPDAVATYIAQRGLYR